MITLNDAIEILRQLPPDEDTDVPNKRTGDTIYREAAIEAVVEQIMEWDGMFRQTLNCMVRDSINSLLSAEPQRKRGKWIPKDNRWQCDQCGCMIRRYDPLKGNVWNYNYCPNCGARMTED